MIGRVVMIPEIEDQDYDSRPMKREYDVISIDGDTHCIRNVQVCREVRVNLEVNGVHIASLTASPRELAEFACGYCITEGIVRQISDIVKVETDGNHIRITVFDIDKSTLSRPKEIRTSGCVGIVQDAGEFGIELPTGTRVSRAVIFSAMECLNDHAVLWRETGGTHCTVLYDSHGTAVAHAEDVGRHNSVDKAIGKALLSGIDTGKTFLCCSGRMPEGMVSKVYHAGIPIVVTNNAPSAAGIDLARRVNLTLAGFVRPPRMNIYSAPERILVD